jgi:ankyrin repeat protein
MAHGAAAHDYFTALADAVRDRKRDILIYAIENHAEETIRWRERFTNKTFLMLLSQYGLDELTARLLKKAEELGLLKELINTTDIRGRSALIFAARFGQNRTMAVLCKNGASTEPVDCYGYTARRYAAERNQPRPLNVVCNPSTMRWLRDGYTR